MQDRRSFLKHLALAAGLGALPLIAEAGPARQRHRRRVRRRVRRRTRRRAVWRAASGRRLLVVPLAVAIGWELALDDRVVIVKEVHEHHIVVDGVDGKPEKIDVIKEDNDKNGKDLEGSEYEAESDE